MSRNVRQGRPRRFRNRQEFEEAVESYFSSCEEAGRPPTMSGLCLHLGFKSRSQLDYLEKRSRARGQFSNTIRRARTIIEMSLEAQLVDDETPPARVRACIFLLGSMGGWKIPNEDDVKQEGKEQPVIEEGLSMDDWESRYWQL